MQEGGGVSKSQYGVSAEMASSTPAMAATAAVATSVGQPVGMEMESEQAQLVEAASPISSRPPASAAMNLDELVPLQSGGAGADEDALAASAAAGDGGGVGGGNRWPRQETLALLKIRSEMDAVFRDATLKGPLWEDVSRKLAELGYKRNAKKCKEKFENVHKYYKRTKEGRAGRQDGKSYKFFSELEALHSSAASSSVAGNNSSASLVVPPATATLTINPVVAPVSTGTGIGGMISSPMPISSNIRLPQVLPGLGMFPPDPSAAVLAPAVVSGSVIAPAAKPIGVSFSSNSSSSSPGSDEDDDDEEESLEVEPSNVGSSRKRKRGSTKAGGSSDTRRMMEFFENLMKQVMHKQEVMQQRFLEAIEKREQDRMIREEAWKRQEMARLAREHELMAQDRAISASRDAAIVAFLQKITGQPIQQPTPASNSPVAPPPAVPPSHVPSPVLAATQPPQPSQQQQQQQQQKQQQQQQQQALQHSHRHTQVVMAIPEQQVLPQEIISGGGGSFEPASSRWPKVEVLALIKLRSGLESRYQEAGPKGPLWEEISAGMQRMGYKRNAKRCKEKWENINKYYKKVKESNKKRPEDAKTCPYFHELDALYRKKILGSSSSGGSGNSSFLDQNRPQLQQQQPENIELDPSVAPEIVSLPQPQTTLASTESDHDKNGASTDVQAQASNIALPEGLFGEAIGGAPKKKTL
ncbi:hypothetical protein F2P56_004532 [Juglans regia]|uniref:Trihelix transcription factor GTL1-like isoform X2 n=2 Tax=Juglans regia TaxID=51240 RepID=A0A2I4GLZ2_JUGRE|nr:trihelix transcription factor GTL1-like isoform X2 [Juglans regia]KAF5477926.1 hypothetical protein F2P56_004532 [Juglans regia]